uniref:Odorant receptor n=1 Tax=Sirex nitobei TaxID=1602346 RepID=A0A857N976_9HYME|nr:odorant receptor 8 [Sirex nitobei]
MVERMKVRTNDFVKDNIDVYKWLGSWPLSNQVSRHFERVRYVLGLIVIVVIVVFNVLQYLDLYYNWGDWFYVSENISVSFIFTVFLFKIYVFHSRREEIVKMTEEMDHYMEEIPSGENDITLKLIEHYRDNIRNVKLYFGGTCVVVVVILYTYPIVIFLLDSDKIGSQNLGIHVYCPFPLNDTGTYVSITLLEIAIGWTMSLHTVNFDTFFFSCIIFTIGRFSILRHAIRTMTYSARNRMKLESNDNNFQFIINEMLMKSVCEHQRIIQFSSWIDSILSQIIFIKFFVYSVTICFTGMQVVMTGLSFKLLKLGAYLGAMMIQILLYYWYGNELMLESTKMSEGLYESEWYVFDKRNRQILLGMIMRSQRPLYLTAGQFYNVTLETFLSFLGGSYSYFALIKQLYDS